MEIINSKDFAILLALESNPLMITKELAREINISWPTTKKRRAELIDKGIIRDPVAVYLPEALGLKKVSAIINFENYSGFKTMERIIGEFPYIHYRSRATSNQISIFAQFDIPNDPLAHKNLEFYFEELSNLNIIRNVDLFESSSIRSEFYPQLSKFDLDSLTWKFSWDDWFYELQNASPKNPDKIQRIVNLEDFTPLRFNILKELTSNASLKQADLMSIFELSRTEAHRHYNFVKNQLIRDIRLNYRREFFDLTETYLIIIENISKDLRNKIFNQIQRNPPPFRFAIDILKDEKILLWGNMSLSQINVFLPNLWEICNDIKINRLNTRDKASSIYQFYPPNFDFKNMNWRISSEYMVTEPLKFIK